MADLRVRAADAAIELPVENHPDADARADGDVEQAAAAAARAPRGFPQRGGVGVVLHRHADVKQTPQIGGQRRSPPARQGAHLAIDASLGVYRAGAADSNPIHTQTTLVEQTAQNATGAREPCGITQLGSRRRLSLHQDATSRIHDAYGDLGSADVNGCGHGPAHCGNSRYSTISPPNGAMRIAKTLP